MKLLFDRGTLLCVDAPASAGLASIPGVLWDPRVSRFRAPAFRHAELRRKLHARGILVEDAALDSVRPLDRPSGPARDLELRPYQEASLCAWEHAERRGIIVLPTGSGKTRTALAAIAGARVASLCLVPTRVLLHQWCAEIERAFGAGAAGCLGDGERRLAPVTVATYESAYRLMARIGNRFELLVVDEVHHFGSGARDEALEMSTAPARLGLTATPPPPGPAADRLAALVGPVVFHLQIGDLAGRYLADFDRVTLSLGLTEEEGRTYADEARVFQEAFRRFMRMAPSATWLDFVRAASRTDEGRRALGAWRASRRLLGLTTSKAAALAALLRRHRRSRVLVFTSDNETAYRISREHLVMPITCDIKRSEREAALARFRRGELGVLVSSQVLNEGLDVPDADVGIIVGSARGEREYVQRIGRLLRPADGKRAVVYELVTASTFETRQARCRARSLGRHAAGGL